MKKIVALCSLLAISLFVITGNAQKRQRPGNMRHTDKEVQNMRKMDPVKCTYVSDNHVFYGDVYATGPAGRIKMGTSTLTLKGGKYTISFTSAKFEMRDVQAPQDKGKYNPWRKEKLYNDFTQSGNYTTFKKAGTLYLRLHDGNSSNYLTDVPLSGTGAKSFVIDEDGLRFEYTLR